MAAVTQSSRAAVAAPALNGETLSNGLGYAGQTASEAGPSKQRTVKSEDELEIHIEFGGGLHLLFSQQPKHTVRIPRNIPESDPPEVANMRYLVKWLKGNLLSERVEMFGEGDSIRPGILVLINEADWELEGELEYELKDGDEVVFISTLHGG